LPWDFSLIIYNEGMGGMKYVYIILEIP